MTIKNYLFNEDDLERVQVVRDKENWRHDFPHQDLWLKGDAILKWVSVLERFRELYPENGVKVVDLGCARGSVPHVISSWGNEVYGVDTPSCGGRLDHDCEGSEVTMIDSEAFTWFEQQEDESVDVFIDLCAYSHFCGPTGRDENGRSQFDKIFEQIHRCLKPGGHVIMSSDCDVKQTTGEFVSPKTIIDDAKKNNLQLVGKWSNRKTKIFTVPKFDHLNVCSLTFIKK